MKKLFLVFAVTTAIVSCSEKSPSSNDETASNDLSYNNDKGPISEEVFVEEEEQRPNYQWKNSAGSYTMEVGDANAPYSGYAVSNGVKAAGTKVEPKRNIEKKIIKKAQVGYQVDDYAAEMDRVRGLVSKYEGYISSENAECSNYKQGNSLIIRLPSDGLDPFMDELTNGPKRLDYKRVTAQDVTEEFVDIQARLKTKREVEARFREILGKAKTIEEILEVENQLRGIREEIEAKEGRLKYLENLVGLSTVDLDFYQNLDYKYIPENNPGFWARMAKSLDGGWNGLLNLMIGLTNLWPFWLVLGVLLYFMRRYLKRVKVKKD